MRILLVNPPIYDFTAYDFWLKPYGMLQVAGLLRGCGDLDIFDYLDRHHSSLIDREDLKSDRWGRGKFTSQKIGKPKEAAFVLATLSPVFSAKKNMLRQLEARKILFKVKGNPRLENALKSNTVA